MLTRLHIRRFKQFDDVDIELGSPVVFIGPNNSGKTTALQALALWDIGLRRWAEKRAGRQAEKRPGVAINRRDLIAVPVPDSNLLWQGLHVRDVNRRNGKQETTNIRIEIEVSGVSGGKEWQCGLEFDYANDESFYCRPLRSSPDGVARHPIPDAAHRVTMAFLPPMSGLAATETRLEPGAINVRIGEGRTAEVLRNLAYQVFTGADGPERWQSVVEEIRSLFGVVLDAPQYLSERGEISMSYKDRSGVRLDLSSSGRGLQQTLLLLAHLEVNPGAVLLLDEPDAHLEILRQREVYSLLTRRAEKQGCQIVAASHSEVVLNEAADKDVVVSFVGRPHRIDDRGSQTAKALKEIGFDQFYQAEQKGWVLYLEGSTDLAMLQAFASVLGHRAQGALAQPFVKYVQNQPKLAQDHFYGLREGKPDLVGFALFDRRDPAPNSTTDLAARCWSRREIENYLALPGVLSRWAQAAARQQADGPLWEAQLSNLWGETMNTVVQEVSAALATLGKGVPESPDIKATDEFLDPVFKQFFERLQLPNLIRKSDYHVLAAHLEPTEIDPEVAAALDAIADTAERARHSES